MSRSGNVDVLHSSEKEMCLLFKDAVSRWSGRHGEKRRSQSVSKGVRLKSTVIGGSTTNFLAALMKNKI